MSRVRRAGWKVLVLALNTLRPLESVYFTNPVWPCQGGGNFEIGGEEILE